MIPIDLFGQAVYNVYSEVFYIAISSENYSHYSGGLSMKIRAKILPLIICTLLLLSFAIAPMLTLTASADDVPATLSFESTDNRTSYSTSQQVWEQNGITFTNDKAESTTNVGDYSKPIRLYKSSSITVEYAGMGKIVFNCNSSSYANVLAGSITSSNAAVSTDSSVVTVTFASADSFTIESLGGQVRIDSIEVYVITCQHAGTTTEATAATCEESGSIKVVCTDCGAILSTEVIAAIGHDYIDGACSVCGESDPASVDYSGRYCIFAKRSSGNYFYMTSDLGSASTKRYAAVDSGLTELPEEVSNSGMVVFVVEKNSDGSYYIYAEGIDGDENYLGWTSGNSGTLVAEAAARALNFEFNEGGYYIVTLEDSGTIRNLALNSSSGSNYFAWYATAQSNNLYFVPFVESECEHSFNDGAITKSATCGEEGIRTYTCTECGETKTEPIDIIDHIYGDDSKCTMCGKTDPASVDYSGRYYIFAARNSGNYFYMTSDLGTASTKRYTAVDSGSATVPSGVTDSKYDCVFIVEKTGDSTYRIYVEGASDEARYVGWSSGNSGKLVAEDEAAELNIELNADNYIVSFADSNGDTRYLALNNTTGNNYFAFYTSLQVSGNLYLVTASEAVTEITGASVTIGSDLAMNYYVTLAANEDISDYSMRFTMNGESVTVTDYAVVDSEYVFKFTGIAPQCMGDSIKAELLCGGEAVATKDSYSVKEYAEALIDSADPEGALYALAVDMLHYGAAAQEYKNYKTDNLVNAGVAESVTAAPTEKDNLKSVNAPANDDTYFSAVGVRFDYNNTIYAKFKAPSLEGLTVRINGSEATAEDLGGGSYIVYSDAIYATGFDAYYTIELVSGEAVIHTITYSVNSYAYAMASSTDAADEMKALAVALYRYGASAEAYN